MRKSQPVTLMSVSLALSLVLIVLPRPTQAGTIVVGKLKLAGNFTLNHNFNFNNPAAAPFGMFGTMTVQSATGIFGPRVAAGDVLAMNTPFMYVSSGPTPVEIPCGGTAFGSLPQPMRWTIGGFTIDTLFDLVTGADFVGRYCLGLTDFSGNGFNPHAYPVYPCSAWSFTAPPYDISNFPVDITGAISLTFAISYQCPAPAVTCSVATDELWPPNHALTTVGFVASATNNCNGTITATNIEVQVFSNEQDASTGRNFSPDADNLTANGELRLRAECQPNGDGRVYLIVAKATDSSGDTGFCASSVTVPRSQSADSRASVALQAALALDYALGHLGNPPPGYFLIGNGPIVGPK
jgi:hypothetical protein